MRKLAVSLAVGWLLAACAPAVDWRANQTPVAVAPGVDVRAGTGAVVTSNGTGQVPYIVVSVITATPMPTATPSGGGGLAYRVIENPLLTPLPMRTVVAFQGPYVSCVDSDPSTVCTWVTPTPQPTVTPMPTATPHQQGWVELGRHSPSGTAQGMTVSGLSTSGYRFIRIEVVIAFKSAQKSSGMYVENDRGCCSYRYSRNGGAETTGGSTTVPLGGALTNGHEYSELSCTNVVGSGSQRMTCSLGTWVSEENSNSLNNFRTEGVAALGSSVLSRVDVDCDTTGVGTCSAGSSLTVLGLR